MKYLRTVAAAAAILLAAGCGATGDGENGPGDAGRSDWDRGAGAEWEGILAAAREEGTVVVGGPAFLAEAMTEAFERDTGVSLEWLGATGSELSARLQQEASSGSVTMDLKLGGPQELFVDYKSLLEPLAPQLVLPSVTDESSWRGGSLPWSDPEETYMLRTSAYVFGWVVVNRDVIDPARIRVWDDLLADDLRGKIVSGDIAAPSPGQGAAQHLYNVKGMDFVEELYLGQEVELIVDNTQVVEQVVRGTYPIALGAIQTVVERFRSQGIDNLEIVLPEDHPGYLTGGFSVIVQARGAPHPNAAQVFLNWYASPAGQAVYEQVMLETSARTDVSVESVPDYVRPRETADYWEDWELDWLVNHRAQVAEYFGEMVGGR
jgi:ABC-type Fe3+ transport system substrate-binding protein